MKLGAFIATLAAFALVGAATNAPAHASSLMGYYYMVPNAHPDVQNGIDGNSVTGLVAATIGPNGLPVATAFAQAYAGPSGPITDIDSITSEILWWSTAGQGVLFEKSQVDFLPFNYVNFFPDSETSNSNFFRAVHWTGVFNLPAPGSVTFSLGADDDAWIFVNGQLQVDNGGVKDLDFVPNVISGLSAGVHTVDIFYIDRHTSLAEIRLSADIELQPVPEPTTFALAGLGLAGIAKMRNRRK